MRGVSEAGPFRTMVSGILRRAGVRLVPPEARRLDPADAAIVDRVMPFTMTSVERVLAVIDAARHVVRAGIPGAFVECGVWRGGSMMAAALALREAGAADRDLFLYDTFEGMTEPQAVDVDPAGRPAIAEYTARREKNSGWCAASADEVRRNLLSVGYDSQRLIFVEGKVEETIPRTAPDSIALLRLDTDWYESTRHELAHLYPRLVPGGILIIDDYGHWAGARHAVDEYFSEHGPAPLLTRIDYTGRMAVRPR